MKPRLSLNEDGVVVREKYEAEEIQVNLETYLMERAARNLKILTPSLGPVGRWASDFRMIFAPPLTPGKSWLAAFRLPELNFHTAWDEVDGKLVPTFAREGTIIDPAGLGGVLKARLPDFVECWYFLRLSFNNAAQPSAWMMAIVPTPEGSETPRRWCRIPVPNQHSEGSLCYGSLPPGSLPWKEAMSIATLLLDAWMQSPWNQDLFDSYLQAKFYNLFKWTADGNLIGTNKATWAANCPAQGVVDDPFVELFMKTRLEELNALDGI